MLTKGKVNKARPLCDLIKLNTIVAGKASTGTHVTSDLLNTGRFYMALYPPTGVLTSRLRGYLSATTSRGHLGTTYMVSPEDKHRDITRTKRGLTISSQSCCYTATSCILYSHVLHPLQPRPASSTATPGSTAPTYLGLTHLTSTSQRHWTSLPVHKRHLDIFTSAHIYHLASV